MDRNNSANWVARGFIILTNIYGGIYVLIYFFTIGELSLFPLDCKIGNKIKIFIKNNNSFQNNNINWNGVGTEHD